MGDIANLAPDQICSRIRASNEQSAKSKGNQKYLVWENLALQSDYEFIACPCEESCWCKRNACIGHYRLKVVAFEKFLDTYVTLWTPPKVREAVKRAVLKGDQFDGRQKNAILPLRRLRENWPYVLAEVRRYDECGLCDPIVPLHFQQRGKLNMFEAKMWSQLYYDSLVPFDRESRDKIREAQYPDPEKNFLATNRELFSDLRKLSDSHGLGVPGIRGLDSPWTVESKLQKPAGGQALSRVVDKIFYRP